MSELSEMYFLASQGSLDEIRLLPMMLHCLQCTLHTICKLFIFPHRDINALGLSVVFSFSFIFVHYIIF